MGSLYIILKLIHRYDVMENKKKFIVIEGPIGVGKTTLATKGVKKFRSSISKDAQYKFEIPGIYAYWCTPHKGMGMIGFVVVGNNKSNLEAWDDSSNLSKIGILILDAVGNISSSLIP